MSCIPYNVPNVIGKPTQLPPLPRGPVPQWGAITQSSDLVSHTFPTSYASATYALITQIAGPSRTTEFGEPSGDNYYPINISKTGFKMLARSGERQDTIYYVALGS